MSLSEKIGKRFTHDTLGKVQVVAVVEKSRTKVQVSILDRGKGYNKKTKKYSGVRNSVGWYRGQNRQYGNVDEVHIKTLK
jgi:hypothetical protein